MHSCAVTSIQAGRSRGDRWGEIRWTVSELWLPPSHLESLFDRGLAGDRCGSSAGTRMIRDPVALLEVLQQVVLVIGERIRVQVAVLRFVAPQEVEQVVTDFRFCGLFSRSSAVAGAPADVPSAGLAAAAGAAAGDFDFAGGVPQAFSRAYGTMVSVMMPTNVTTVACTIALISPLSATRPRTSFGLRPRIC